MRNISTVSTHNMNIHITGQQDSKAIAQQATVADYAKTDIVILRRFR